MKQEKLKAIIRCILGLFLCVAGMLILMGLVSVLAGITHNEFLMNMFAGTQKDPVVGAFSKIIICILQYTPFVLIALLMAIKVWKYKISDLGLTPIKKDWKDFVVGLIAGAAGISIAFLCLILSGSIKVTGCSMRYGECVLISFVAYIIVGFGEEIVCRGLLMLSLKPLRSKIFIAVFTSVLFAAMHLGNNGISLLAFFNLFLFGLFAAYCFIRSGSIWLPIGFHITWNFVQGNIYGFHVSGNSEYSLVSHNVLKDNIFTGGEFGPEGGLGVTIALLLCYAFAYMYYRNITEDRFLTNNN